MPTTPELREIRIFDFKGHQWLNPFLQIRCHWTNDRHHAADLSTREPLAVAEALRKLAWLIERDMHRGEL